MKKKPLGWLPTRPSPHQIYMMRMLSKGWRFKLHNNCPGSWNTWWALRRRDLVTANDGLTEKGKAVLERYGKHLTPMEAYFREAMTK